MVLPPATLFLLVLHLHPVFALVLSQRGACYRIARWYVPCRRLSDRGQFSCEVILHLFALKLRHPDKVYLIRGNHECSSVSHRDIVSRYFPSERMYSRGRGLRCIPLRDGGGRLTRLCPGFTCILRSICSESSLIAASGFIFSLVPRTRD